LGPVPLPFQLWANTRTDVTAITGTKDLNYLTFKRLFLCWKLKRGMKNWNWCLEVEFFSRYCVLLTASNSELRSIKTWHSDSVSSFPFHFTRANCAIYIIQSTCILFFGWEMHYIILPNTTDPFKKGMYVLAKVRCGSFCYRRRLTNNVHSHSTLCSLQKSITLPAFSQ
jgi:hypothetical protein